MSKKSRTSAHKKRRIILQRRQAIGLGVFLSVVVGVMTFLFLYDATITQQVAQTNAQTQKYVEESDAKLKEIKARKAAEEKARQEAAAKDAAEKAKVSDASSAGSIDASACNRASGHKDPSRIDVMVNKKHCIQPLTFAPDDLVTSNGATLSAKAMMNFNKLFAAAAAAGQGFYVTSSYRSYNDQVATYNYWVSVSGQAGADTYSARPGYSEHQTGLVVDVAASGCVLDCFGSTAQYKWFQRNAFKYGFIQRYYAGSEAVTGYKAEEWHYRYVGVDVATDLKSKGIKTLEEYWNMPGGNY